jgi:hypothetical protein
MPLRRFTHATIRRPSPGFHAANKQQHVSPLKILDPFNAAAHPDQISFRQSISTDCSSSLGEEDQGPVDLDILDEKMAEEELIRYFEEEVVVLVKDDGTSKMESGPIDLDMLEDDFYYYDKDEGTTEPEVKSHIQVQLATDGANTRFQQNSMSRVEAVESRQDQIVSKCLDTSDDNDGSLCDNHSIGEIRGSAPVDIDDVYDLDTTFDSILDEHEDNFMVWTANRKSVNAIIAAEEHRTTRIEKQQKYGQSLRREKKRWSS